MHLPLYLHVVGIALLAMLGFACIEITDSYLKAVGLWIVWCAPVCWMVSRRMQLHHRYFDCNYGDDAMPWDNWFGSFHDGTSEATARMRALQSRKRGQRKAHTATEVD